MNKHILPTSLLCSFLALASLSFSTTALAQFSSYASFQACWLAIQHGDVNAYEAMGDHLKNVGFNNRPDKKTAAIWYRVAAEHGNNSARQKLAAMGQQAGPTTQQPLPSCPSERVGAGHITGKLIRYTKHAKTYGFLIEDASGHQMDVIIDHSLAYPFTEVHIGMTLSLSYTSTIGIDIWQAQCVKNNYYVAGSGRILSSPDHK